MSVHLNDDNSLFWIRMFKCCEKKKSILQNRIPMKYQQDLGVRGQVVLKDSELGAQRLSVDSLQPQPAALLNQSANSCLVSF